MNRFCSALIHAMRNLGSSSRTKWNNSRANFLSSCLMKRGLVICSSEIRSSRSFFVQTQMSRRLLFPHALYHWGFASNNKKFYSLSSFAGFYTNIFLRHSYLLNDILLAIKSPIQLHDGTLHSKQVLKEIP